MAVLTRVILCVSVLLTAAACRTGQEQWGPFRGQVVDEETGKPIAGANVMVLWIREPPSLHFTQWFYDAQETVTDSDGRFEIPRRTRFLTAWVEKPGLSVFAPGYLVQEPQVTPSNGQRYVDPTIVEMRPLKTREQQCEGLRLWSGPSIDIGTRAREFMETIHRYTLDLDCRWPGGR